MKINKATFDALPSNMQAAFKAVEGNDDEYDNGEEAATELKTALEREREEKKKAAKERDDALGSITAAEEKARKEALAEARKGGDFSKIEEDYKARLKAAEEKLEAQAEEANKAKISAALAEHTKEVSGIFVAPDAMGPLIASRLKVSVGEDGIVTTRVLDKAGNPTAATVKDLKQEFLDNADYKGILAGSKASGSGATQAERGGSGATSKPLESLANASPKDMVAHLKAKGAVDA